MSADVELWSIAQPALYTVTIKLTAAGAVVDAVNTTVGFRSANFTAEGFELNGEAVKLRGFCDHPVFVGVGMAVPDRLKLFRAQTLRSVGGNARRMSHAPATPEMLDIYDRLGVMVLDENRGDGPNGYPFGAVVNEDPSWARCVLPSLLHASHVNVCVRMYCPSLTAVMVVVVRSSAH
jgi:beta-galactosidase/beta-glucuronidase